MRVNPLKEDALTADTVRVKDQIKVWKPGSQDSTRQYVVLNTPYTDDDDDLVVDLRTMDGQEVTLLTSEAGLSGGRYDGAWTHVAIIDDTED